MDRKRDVGRAARATRVPPDVDGAEENGDRIANPLAARPDLHGVSRGEGRDAVAHPALADATIEPRDAQLERARIVDRHEARRPQHGLLLGEAHRRRGLRRAVHARIRHRGEPVGELRVQIVAIREASALEERALHVADPALDFPIDARPVRRARDGQHGIVIGEIEEGGRLSDRAGRDVVPVDALLYVIDEQLRRAAERVEGAL